MPEESTNLQNESPAKDYLVVVQCDIVKERCSGYHCEKAFYERSGHFSHYPKEQNTRVLYLTCGGCCGRSLLRKLSHLVRRSQKKENLRPEKMGPRSSLQTVKIPLSRAIAAINDREIGFYSWKTVL